LYSIKFLCLEPVQDTHGYALPKWGKLNSLCPEQMLIEKLLLKTTKCYIDIRPPMTKAKLELQMFLVIASAPILAMLLLAAVLFFGW